MVIDRDSIISQQVEDFSNWTDVARIAVDIFKTEPTPESLDVIRAVLTSEKLWIADTEDKDLIKASKYLDDFFKDLDNTDDEYHFIERLEVQFASMFYGISDTPVFMIESVQLGLEHTLYERPYFEVEAEFESWGFKGMPRFNEPFDHACQELSYLIKHVEDADGFLRTQEFGQYMERAEAIIRFCRSHFDKWIPDVAKQILSQNCSKYYKSGAYLLIGLNNVLHDYFSMMESDEIEAAVEVQ